MVLILEGIIEIGVGKEQSMFGIFKAFDQIKSSYKSNIFSPNRPLFLNACAACSKLPFNISTMMSVCCIMYVRSHLDVVFHEYGILSLTLIIFGGHRGGGGHYA